MGSLKAGRFVRTLRAVIAPNIADIKRAVELALAEDVGNGDVTTLATVPETSKASGTMQAREPLVVAGLALAEAAFAELSGEVKIELLAKDGEHVAAKKNLMSISGP